MGGDDCAYTVLIKTEDLFRRGKMVMELQNADGETTVIKDLKPWANQMGLDIFDGRAKCLYGPVSTMNLDSNTWRLNSAELDVMSSRLHIHSRNELFAVEQWEGDSDSTSFHKGSMNECSCLIFMANSVDNVSSLRAISGVR
ncbi:Elicitor-inducible protein EIG-J7 [Tripterygium wilfordii]|uniref:Elicitor-inducible protein EIG-J7 n=1 Tax=Tripterygium wilfordii TaxID=458696 RepID=A0A7J7CWC7_TRIWF|nr:Elicitor-inducible protein EIG-J7 [Tripterygium wilfordii]